MLDQKIPSTDLLLHIAKALDVPLHGLVAVIELLDDGGTVPFHRAVSEGGHRKSR